MATELITRTWCDLCTALLSDDVKQAAVTWRFGFNPPDERWRWVEIDLCDDHVSSTVHDMMELVTKHGREGALPKRGSGRPPGRTMPATAAGEFVCPECGQPTRTKQGLGTHRSRIHGIPGVNHKATR